MSDLSDYLENELLDHVLGTGSYSAPGTLHLGLFTANPGESGVSNEVSGGSYARVAITNNATNFPECSLSGEPTKGNGANFVFPKATAAWGTITHWAIYDVAASSGTNMIAHGALPTQRSVSINDTPSIASGSIAITMANISAGGFTSYSKRKLLDLVFGAATYTMPALHVGIGTALVGEAITEWTDSAYARSATAFDAASGGSAANTSIESFNASVADGTAILTHLGVWDDATAGNLVFVGTVDTSRTALIGDDATLAAGALVLTLQ
jgi:hypothetical protein